VKWQEGIAYFLFFSAYIALWIMIVSVLWQLGWIAVIVSLLVIINIKFL
jgi:hypothetical protein